MQVLNVHRRRLPVSSEQLAPLIDGLSSRDDALWPRDDWPPMRFDRKLQVGATGGHGPIRYFVEAYEPGRSILFRFTRPAGFDGTHGLQVEAAGKDASTMIHTVKMNVSGRDALGWRLVFGPLHDALLEDGLDRAERFAGGSPRPRNRSLWVRFLRRVLGRKRRPA